MEKPLNRDVIKYFAMFTMLLNHIAFALLPPNTLLSEIFINIGFFTAVTMCYFLVEGYGYTRSKKRYAQRLLLFGIVSEVPFCLALTQGEIFAFCGFNMMFTLFLCFLILCAREHIAGKLPRTLAITGLTVLCIFCDWSFFAPLFTLLFAWAKGSEKRTKCAFVCCAASFGLFNLLSNGLGRCTPQESPLYAAASMAGILLSGFVIVYLYNGKRMDFGRTFSKWFFYLFYPVHLLILGLIRIALL